MEEKQPGNADQNPLTAEELIREHQVAIWRYLRALGCDSSLADDLTQETFLSVLRGEFQQVSTASTRAYLRKVAYNAFISVRRREGKVVAVENLEAFEAAWNELVSDGTGDELIEMLKACMQHLSKRAKWSLEMRFRDKLSRLKIAEKLEITEHGAKNLMQRAKKQLRQCVEEKISMENEND